MNERPGGITYVDWYSRATFMSKKPKPKPEPDRDALVEIASMLTLAHIQLARALKLARDNRLDGVSGAIMNIALEIRREAAVALGSATKGDG